MTTLFIRANRWKGSGFWKSLSLGGRLPVKETTPFLYSGIATVKPYGVGVKRNYAIDVFPGSNALMQKAINIVEQRKKQEDIKFLLSKPSHKLQARNIETAELDSIFEKLRKGRDDSVVSIFMLGAPACGKTQLARQYGEKYFERKQAESKLAFKKKITIVATLDVRNESSLWRSYSRLATDLYCEVQAHGKLKDRLAILKAKVQKKFQDNPDWLFIVDGINDEMAREFDDYWPQPNSDDWGNGRVLVTTSSAEIAKKHDNNSSSQRYECPKMQEDNAVSLLQDMTNIYEKGAKELVNTSYINKNPFDIACAAILITKERSKNPDYTFCNYLESMAKIGEPRMEVPSLQSLCIAVEELAATDSDLKQVFTAMGMCAHDPIPISVINGVLGKDVSEVASVKECPLLLKIPEDSPPIDDYDQIPRIYTHFSTFNQFRELRKKDTRGLQDLQRKLVNSMLNEYDKVSISETTRSKWVQQLLFRHLQQLLQYEEEKKHYLDPDLKIRLAATLSNAHIELNRNPEKSKVILTDLDKEFRSESLHPYNKTKLNLTWAKVHRHLHQYESCASRLSDVLTGINHVHDRLTDAEATECLKECTALSLLYHSSDYDERENLEKAMKTYTKQVGKESAAQLILGEANCGLAHLCFKMGDWAKGKEYLCEAEELFKMKEDEITDYSAYESLAVVYSEIGDHEKSINILNGLIKHMRESYGLDDKPSSILSIPYARLCSAYYYNGDREEAYKAIESCMECLDQTSRLQNKQEDTRISELNEVVLRRPYIPPWTAMHIITTLLCDFGDITYPMNELIERIANAKFEDTPLLLGRLYRHRGFYPKAQKILEQHLRECDGHQTDSIRIGLIWAELGKVYREQGYIIRGVKAFEKAYNIYKQFYVSPNHPEVALIQAELGRVVQLNGNKKCGIEMMKKAVDICKQHMENETCKTPKTHVGIKYAQMLAAFGIVLRYEHPPEEMNEALQYLEEALALQDSTLAEESLYRIRTLYYIGSTYHKKDDFDRAKDKMVQSLQLIEGVDSSHPYKASICTGLGRLLQTHDSEQAEKYMKDAFFIRQGSDKFSSEAHWKVAFAYRSVGEIMFRKGSKVEAFNYLLDANNMFQRLIERESSEREEWLDSRSSSAPDYGIDIIDRWCEDQRSIRNEMQNLLEK